MPDAPNKQLVLINKSETLNLIVTASTDTSIIIDFDETLLLRNSTAEYLDTLRPRLIGFFLIKMLGLLKPWSWLPKPFQGSQTKDWFLVVISTILLPWTRLIWQNQARKLAEQYSNIELIQAVEQNKNSPIIIATLGFNFIIDPILQHMLIRKNIVIGCRFWMGAADRSQGKLLMIQKTLSPSSIKSAIVVTDSYDDLPLLQVVAKPCLVVWSLAKYISPQNSVYLPFFYLEKVKRVEEKYTFKVILGEDLPLLLLAFSWQSTHWLLHSISILLLLVSFWCVSELGYYEHDYLADKYADQPQVSIAYHPYKQMMQTWYPWFWSLSLGAIAITLLNQTQGVNWLDYLSWGGFLLLFRLCFWVYNHSSKYARPWLYLLLQSCRYYGFLAVTSINLIGASLLCSHILASSLVSYSQSNKLQQVPEKLWRCLLLIFLLSAIALIFHSIALWQSWQAWGIMAWCLISAQREVKKTLLKAKKIINS
jgi:hypothetical protein